MINVLAAYVFLQRYFNGEVEEFSLEYSMFLWNLSLNLKDNVNYDTAALAIESVIQQCITVSFKHFIIYFITFLVIFVVC